MPETTVYKNCSVILLKSKVRLARKLFQMQPVSETIFKQEFPDEEFRLGILCSYPAHVIASGFLVVYVCHLKMIVPVRENVSLFSLSLSEL